MDLSKEYFTGLTSQKWIEVRNRCLLGRNEKGYLTLQILMENILRIQNEIKTLNQEYNNTEPYIKCGRTTQGIENISYKRQMTTLEDRLDYAISSLRANIICPDDSIIFFGKIANLSKEEYIDKVRGVTDEEIEYDKLSQIHTCAKICNDKFVFYNQSIKYLCIGLLLFVCFVLFSIILKAS